MVYDISRRKTFENTQRWLGMMRRRAPVNIVLMLIGNKCDLEPQRRQVSKEEGLAFANKNGMFAFVETSAKTGHQVNATFERLLTGLLPCPGLHV